MLRISVAADPSSLPTIAGLREVFRAPGLVIESTADVAVETTAGGTVLLEGVIFGRRAPDGTVSPANGLSKALANDLARSASDVAPTIEGAFVAVAASTDGRASIVTDRFAKPDFYYQTAGAGTIFASGIDLLPTAAGGATYDSAALAHTLTVFGWRPPKQHTIYHGVRRLGVGQYVTVEGGRARVETRRFEPAPTGDYQDRDLDRYAELMLDAVRLRSSADGNVVYLSSGWDSTAILACLVKLHGAKKVRAVIGRMKYSERAGIINQFEIERAAAVAAYYGIRLDIVEFDYATSGPGLFERVRPLLQRHNIFGLGALNHWKLAEFVAATATANEAVFAGEISDGVHNFGFSQYATIFHPTQSFREYSDKMASYLFGPTYWSRFQKDGSPDDVIYGWLRDRTGSSQFDEPAGDSRSRALQMLSSFFLRANRMPLWSLRNNRILTEAGRTNYAQQMEQTYLQEAADRLSPETLYSWLIHLYNSFHWQGSTVATIGITAHANHLRMALPFWDSRLHEFLSAMPESWGRGLDLNPTKYPLKWMLKNRIDYPMHLQVGPHSYLYDVNPRFSLAAETLYGSSLTGYLRDQVKGKSYHAMLDAAHFDLAYLDGLVEAYVRGDEVDGGALNDLTFIVWMSAGGAFGAK